MATFRFSAFADEYSPNFDEQIKGLLENGIHLIEPRGIDSVNISDITTEKAEEIKKKLDAAGIGISAIGSPIGKIQIDGDFDADLDLCKRTVEIGEMVMKRLKSLDEVAYVRFASVYRQFKDINTFMEELTHLLEEKA